jgi:hypothetical protein
VLGRRGSMRPLTPQLSRTPIAYGTCDFLAFAQRSTEDARAVVRKRLALLRTLRETQRSSIDRTASSSHDRGLNVSANHR